MSWWQLSMFVVGSITVVAVGIVSALCYLWQRQERKDGLR